MSENEMRYRWHTLINLTDREKRMLSDWCSEVDQLEKENAELKDKLDTIKIYLKEKEND